MNRTQKQIALAASFVVLMCGDFEPDSPLGIVFLPEAKAIIGVAPGGSVVRRRTVVAASSANASAAAAANAEAEAAAANAELAAAQAAAAAPAAPAGPAVGSVTTILPPGCAPMVMNTVEYQLCGSTYYRPAMQGSNLVYVVSQP